MFGINLLDIRWEVFIVGGLAAYAITRLFFVRRRRLVSSKNKSPR